MRGLLAAAISLCLAATVGASAVSAADPGPVVTVAQGALRGVAEGQTFAFKNIPYAAPPVGDLRWAPPAPPAKWSGVRDASQYGPACLQPDRTDGGGVGSFANQSEDCLSLNIWVPKGTDPSDKLPVMVWIHGGAHRLGSGSAPLYDGANLAAQGVILVTINYRLGLLGFFAHPTITAAAAPDAPLGNYGLMDEIAALKWVRANIREFGGDAANVTVFGESAGAADTVFLLTLPATKGLFAKAIVESGGGMQRPPGLAQQEAEGKRYAQAAGLDAEASLAQLRATPAKAWIDAQGALAGGLGFGPFVDGRLVAETPFDAYRNGHEHDVPLMIGANSNEASVLTTLGVPRGALLAALGRDIIAFRDAYPKGLEEDELVRQALGDVVFVAPSRWVAAQTADGAPSYLYYFSYVAQASRARQPGASHGSEIPFVFKSWAGTALEPYVQPQDRQMSDVMSACWVAFAKTSRPACEGAPAWPAYDPKSDLEMEFGDTISVHTPPKARAFDIYTNHVLGAAERGEP